MKVLISGAGQDAKIAASKLVNSCEVIVGCLDPTNTQDFPAVNFEHLDITHYYVVENVLRRHKPDYIINTAAQSSVSKSFEAPLLTFEVNVNGVLHFLEVARKYLPDTRILNFSSSEIFGHNFSYDYNNVACQREDTAPNPLSPYAVSKLNALDLVRFYRTHYNLYACSAICFNHMSRYRAAGFIEQKIGRWLLDYQKNPNIPKLKLGNLHVYRDWSHARDIIDGAWLMLNTRTPTDYVLGSGYAHSIKELVSLSFSMFGMKWEDHVEVDSALVRDEQSYARADISAINRALGWKPAIPFREMVADAIGVSYIK